MRVTRCVRDRIWTFYYNAWRRNDEYNFYDAMPDEDFFNQLEENYGKEEITREIQNWTAAQWIDYISKRDGVMTAEEFHDFGITELKKRYK